MNIYITIYVTIYKYILDAQLHHRSLFIAVYQ